jgi:hypothetical protein
VRKLFAILQLLLLSLPTFASVTALRGGSDANLPACCRRLGTHHCLMSPAERAAIAGVGFSAVPQPCPYCPKALPAAQHSPASPAPAALFFAQIASHPAGIAQTLAKRRIAQDRARQKRGPPTIA